MSFGVAKKVHSPQGQEVLVKVFDRWLYLSTQSTVRLWTSKPAVLRSLIQEVLKKPMAEFPQGMTEKEKLSECLRVLNCKNRDNTVKSILDGGKDFLGLVFWSIFLEYRIQATSYDGINGNLGLLKWC
jgi:hypothetical protein